MKKLLGKESSRDRDGASQKEASGTQRDPPSTAQHAQEAPLGYEEAPKQLTQAVGLSSGEVRPGPSDLEARDALATDFTTLNEPDVSRRLWDDAFDRILADEKDLAESYLKALTKLLRKEKANNTEEDETSDVSAELLDRTKRQEYLQKLVVNGKAKIAKAAKFSNVVGGIAGFILKAQPMVDVLMTIPQAAPAAIPWAGVCVGLQVRDNMSDLFLILH